MNRSGYYVSNLSGDAEYKSFKPAKLPPEGGIETDERMISLLIEAQSAVSELDGLSTFIPNTDLFISMYVRLEALLSSQIEGTQCTLEDIFDPSNEKNTNLDVDDVINYINALTFALERMKTLPLCLRLLRETHAVLMNGVRGDDKNPGEFRRSQNWIGAAGCSIRDARYIPPNVEDMQSALNDLEVFINSDEGLHPLISCALIHYQFETIHPFLDGNGRLGRMLILLYLTEKKLISKPIIYISYFLKKNQLEYYDRLSEVRRTGNYNQWIIFFLEAVKSAAVDAAENTKKLSNLHDKSIAVLPKSNRRFDVNRAMFDYLEMHPIIDVKSTADAMNISYNTALSAIKKLMDCGILYQQKNNKRNRVFVYRDYLDILRKDV